MTRPIQYVATLKNVAEVSIVGEADYAFWADRRSTECLTPPDATT